MEAEKDNVAKRYLQQIRHYDSRINTKIEEMHRLKAMVTKITPTLKPDVVSGGSSQDKLSDAVAKIVDLEAEIDREIDSYLEAMKKVSKTIGKISNPDQLQVLHKRYVQNKTWEQIACDMNMTYRNVCYIHGKALMSVHEILKGSANEGILGNTQ